MSPEAAAALAGTWSGRFEQLTCTTTAPDGRSCGHHRLGRVTLTLNDSGGALRGTVLFASDQGGTIVSVPFDQPVPVTGAHKGPAVALDSTVTGTVGPIDMKYTFTLAWSSLLSPQRAMDGTVEWLTLWEVPSSPPVSGRRTFRISGVRRIAR